MGTEEGRERAKLIPACVEFAPLFHVGSLAAGLGGFGSGGYITVFDAESAYVLGPVGDA